MLQRIAVSQPLPGVVTNELPGTVLAGTAQELSCQDALDLSAGLPPGSPTYAQGVAIIDSSRPLHVTVTRAFLNDPQTFLRRLGPEGDDTRDR